MSQETDSEKEESSNLLKRENPDEYALKVKALPDEDDRTSLARITLAPVYQAIETVKMISNNGMNGITGAGLTELVDQLESLVADASAGDTEQIDAILISQAQTLDALFNHLTRRSVMNMDQYFEAANTYMKLALRAQANCRVTLECFANLKKPLVKQTNIAHGPQQVNIHSSDGKESNDHAENEKPRNKLLEKKEREKWLDGGSPQEAVGADTDLETVGEIDRAKVA